MYEDSWYSFVPESTKKGATNSSNSHKRRQSLLQQPNGPVDSIKPLADLLERPEDDGGPLPAHVPQRANSCSNLHSPPSRTSRATSSSCIAKDRYWEALQISGHDHRPSVVPEKQWDVLDSQLAESSIEEYTLYRDQLGLTQRHLDSLISGTTDALRILASLSDSFKAVEDQTSSFQAQCEDLLSDQQRLQKAADHIGTDLHYYAYLDTVTRRLNAPGASRLTEDEDFSDMLDNLDQCSSFMQANPEYRDAESYEARYQSLLTKALHLLETSFSSKLDKLSVDLASQIAATTSDSARHALAYGRFEDLLLESRALVPNLHSTFRRVFHEFGGPAQPENINRDIYANTAQNLVDTYLAVRDRDLKPLIQHDLDEFKSEAEKTSAETAARNFLKQSFERAWNEFGLFKNIFGVEPHFSNETQSAFALLNLHQRQLINIGNLSPLAHQIQPVLQTAGLNGICAVVGWLMDEYLMMDPDDEPSEFSVVCQELTARLLSEHLWTFTDAAFEAEIAKMAKAPVSTESLKPQTGPYPLITRAVELLSLFDGCMPKDRCQKSSPVVFRLVQTSIQALQKAESRLRSQFNPKAPADKSTDPDLFMVKNLLVLKNSLLSLEIGDVRDTAIGGMLGLQHFGAIWDALTPATNLIGWVGSFIPWRRDGGSNASNNASSGQGRPGSSASGNPGGTTASHDAGEMLDELLRKCIIGFTQRWGHKLYDARGKKSVSVRDLEKELDQVLELVFSTQPEVSAKLKEAIDDSVRALVGGRGTK